MKKMESFTYFERNYTFNFRRFKELKKKIKKYLKEKYGENLPEIFHKKEFREAFYKYVLWFSGSTNVFNSRRDSIEKFNLTKDVKEIVEDTKRYVMKILYK